MTALYDPQSVEARKARYSQELAAYTLRQWGQACQDMENGENKEESVSPSSRRDRSRSSSMPRDSEKIGRQRQGAYLVSRRLLMGLYGLC